MRKRHLRRIRRRGLPHPAPGRIVFLLLRKAAAGIASILSLPALKPVVLTITAVFLLLAAVPYGVSLLSKGMRAAEAGRKELIFSLRSVPILLISTGRKQKRLRLLLLRIT